MASNIRATVGGMLAPEHVVGRDELIADLWDRLENGSVLLTAERRVGKTTIIRKMQAEAPPGKLVYFRDISRVRTPIEFAQLVFEDVESALSKRGKVQTKARQLLSQIGGVEVSGFKLPEVAAPHWKTLLERTIEDLMEHCGQDVVFLWDEVPWMLETIRDGATSPAEGQRLAMEVLDILRALRQTHPSLRMVLTGSIGLHHVVTALREKGYHNAPLNDLDIVDVPPLETKWAVVLATQLLQSETILTDDEAAVAQEIAEGVGGFAYYVHHLVTALKGRKSQITTPDIVQQLINAALEDDQDRWQLRHFKDRLSSYYGPRATLALHILDEVGSGQKRHTFKSLLNAARSQDEKVDPELVRDLLDLLRRDHYLTLNGGHYTFRYQLIGRWWRVYRGLEN